MVDGNVEFLDSENNDEAFEKFINSPLIVILKKDFHIMNTYLREINELSDWIRYID